MPVFTEVTLEGGEPLARHELRALCDEHRRQGAIERALAAWGTKKEPAPASSCAGVAGGGSWAVLYVLAAWRRRRAAKGRPWWRGLLGELLLGLLVIGAVGAACGACHATFVSATMV